MAADRGIADQLDFLTQCLVEGSLALGAVIHATFGFAAPQEVDHGHGLLNELAHGPCPLGADHIVWVFALGHQRKAQRFARFKQWQSDINHAVRGTKASGIAIERDHWLIGDAPEHLELMLCNGCAKRRDRAFKPRL